GWSIRHPLWNLALKLLPCRAGDTPNGVFHERGFDYLALLPWRREASKSGATHLPSLSVLGHQDVPEQAEGIRIDADRGDFEGLACGHARTGLSISILQR